MESIFETMSWSILVNEIFPLGTVLIQTSSKHKCNLNPRATLWLLAVQKEYKQGNEGNPVILVAGREGEC